MIVEVSSFYFASDVPVVIFSVTTTHTDLFLQIVEIPVQKLVERFIDFPVEKLFVRIVEVPTGFLKLFLVYS